MEDDERRAIELLQRAWKRKRENAAWHNLLKRMPELRNSYLDPAAISGGAESNLLYSDTMLAARELLRTNPVVVAAIDDAWSCLVGPTRNTLSRMTYYTMSRKLYLAALVHDAEDTGEVDVELIDSIECTGTISTDWETDAGGKEALDRNDFHACLFQLADTYTKGVSCDEYASFITAIVQRIVRPPAAGTSADDYGNSGEDESLQVWEWREDQELLDRLTVLATSAGERKAIQKRAAAWKAAFKKAFSQERKAQALMLANVA